MLRCCDTAIRAYRSRVMLCLALGSQPPTGSVVSLDPGRLLDGLQPPRVELVEDFGRQRRGLAGGENLPERCVELLGRWITQDRDVPDAVEVEAVGRELAPLVGEDRLLGLLVGC